MIVRDMHQGRAESALNADHFLAKSRAQREVEARERFVKQKHARLPSERATDRNALALAAGKGVGTPCQHMVESENTGNGVDLGSSLGPVETSCAKSKSQVIGDRQMRIKRRVLKDHGDIALVRRQVSHLVPLHPDAAVAGRFQPGDQSQESGLARSRRPEHDHQLARLDGQIDRVQSMGPTRKRFRESPEFNLCQGVSHLS